MLRDKVLPSGMGHTTHCFLQVEGVDGDEAFLTVGGDGQRRSVEVRDWLGRARINRDLGGKSQCQKYILTP